MKVALIIGKDKSTGIPGKNWRPILGRPMVEYPLMAAHNCKKISKIYVSTDSPTIIEIASKYNTKIINRPAELALPSSPTEDVIRGSPGISQYWGDWGRPSHVSDVIKV